MRSDLELQIDLASGSPFGLLILGLSPSLPATAIQNDLDVPVVTKALQQVLVQARLVARDQKQMSGHVLVYCRSTLCMAGHFFLTDQVRSICNAIREVSEISGCC